MLELNSETFLTVANKKDVFICIFYYESKDNLQELILRVFLNNHQTISDAMGYLDVEKAPDIALMFGISTVESSIIIMRSQVVLLCEPISSFLEKYNISSIVDQIKHLDMEKIKNEIQTEREGVAHLFGRRVCPTAKRTRGKDK